MKCQRCHEQLSVSWSFCPYCSQPVETDGLDVTEVMIAGAGLAPLSYPPLMRQDQFLAIREIVQSAVRQALLEFFSAGTVAEESVWVMIIDDQRASFVGETGMAVSHIPRVSFHRPNRLQDVPFLLRSAVEIVERAPKPGNSLHLACVKALTEVLNAGEKHSEALLAARKALAWAEANSPASDPARARYLHHCAQLLHQSRASLLAQDERDDDEEVRDLTEVIHIARLMQDVDWCVILDALRRLAEVHLEREDFPAAESLLRRLLKALEAILGEDHLQTAAIRYHLGYILRSTSRLQEGEAMLGRALQVFGEHHRKSGKEHELFVRAKEHYVHLMVDRGIAVTKAWNSANDICDGRKCDLRCPSGDTREIDKWESRYRLDFTAACQEHPKCLPIGSRFRVEISLHPAEMPSELDFHGKLKDFKAEEPKRDLDGNYGTSQERPERAPAAPAEVGVNLTLAVKPVNVSFADPGEPRREFMVEWQGVKKTIALDLACPNTLADQNPRETAEVFADGVRIGTLEVDLHFVESGTDPVSVECRFARVSSAYVCYASEDRYEVLGRLSRLRWVVPELKLALHAEELRSRGDYLSELHETVSQHSRFFLFWSNHAWESEHVSVEWHLALDLKGPGSIDLVLTDLEADPPELLASAFEHCSCFAMAAPGRSRRALPGPAGRYPSIMKSVAEIFSISCPEHRAKLPKGDPFTLRVILHRAQAGSLSLSNSAHHNAALNPEVTLALQKPARLEPVDQDLPLELTRPWTGGEETFEFRLRCPAEVSDPACHESLAVYAAGIPVGNIPLTLHFEEHGDSASIQGKFEPVLSTYACFAPSDHYEVQGRLDGVKRLLPDLPNPSNGSGTASAATTCKNADRLVLFWSSNARESQLVAEEWNDFYERKGIGSIDVVRIEPNVRPPANSKLRPAFDRALPLKARMTHRSGGRARRRDDLQPIFKAKLPEPYSQQLQKGEIFVLTLTLEESLSAIAAGADAAHSVPGNGPEIALVFQPNDLVLADGSSWAVRREQWDGSEKGFPFEVICPRQVASLRCSEKIRVFVEGVPIGTILLDFHFSDQATGELPVNCEFDPIHSACAYYSPEDRHNVRGRLDGVLRVMPSLELRLHPADLPSHDSGVEIRESERFFLFWSSQSKASKKVREQWTRILLQRDIGAMDIVRIEAGVAPVKELEPAFDLALPLPEECLPVPSVACPEHAEMLPKGKPFTLKFALALPSELSPALKARDLKEMGTKVHLVFRPERVRFAQDPSRKLRIWRWTQGAEHSLTLTLECPEHVVEGSFQEKIQVFAEGIRVGAAVIELHFEDRGRYGKAARCWFDPAPASYACFAPQDSYEVLDTLEKARRLVPGIGLGEARSSKYLRSDANNVELAIRESERFLLFWTSGAKKSGEVARELAQAMKKGTGTVDLVVPRKASKPPKALTEAYRRSLGYLLRKHGKRRDPSPDSERGEATRWEHLRGWWDRLWRKPSPKFFALLLLFAVVVCLAGLLGVRLSKEKAEAIGVSLSRVTPLCETTPLKLAPPPNPAALISPRN